MGHVVTSALRSLYVNGVGIARVRHRTSKKFRDESCRETNAAQLADKKTTLGYSAQRVYSYTVTEAKSTKKKNKNELRC